jgi:hypothetical protein
MMAEIEIFTTCAERLKSLETPTAAQQIDVIPTPFFLDGKEILLGKRHQGHLIALFPNTSNNYFISGGTAKLSNGFQISMQTLIDPKSKDPLPFIELSNIGNIDVILFGAFLDELLRLIEGGSGSLIEEIKNLLDKWKSMLTLDTEKVMSLSSVIGLFGELLLLDHLVNVKKIAALDNWVGPSGNRHDFEFASHSIEVKSTTVKNGSDIHVNGVNQLEAYNGKSVAILRIKLETEPSGTSLPGLINKIKNANNLNSENFSEKLIKYGYLQHQEHLYSEICFQPVEFQIIPVNANFPRITTESLLSIDPTSRIKDVSYVVNVSGLETQSHSQLNSINFEGLL